MADDLNNQTSIMPDKTDEETEIQAQEEFEEQDKDKAEVRKEEQVDELEKLNLELENTREKADEYLDGWQRSRAEFANFKKRVEKQQAQVYQNAAGSIIKKYLDVLDDLERALQNTPEEGDGALWAEGIDLIYRKFLTILECEGITRMDTEGMFFDPTLHEAVTSEEDERFESGKIIEVLQQGYQLGDRVLRPAKVRVAK